MLVIYQPAIAKLTLAATVFDDLWLCSSITTMQVIEFKLTCTFKGRLPAEDVL